MPFEIAVHPDRRLAFFRFHGVISVATAAQALLAYIAHRDFDPGYAMLADARQITRVEADFLSIFNKVTSLPPELRKLPPGPTCAILVGDETTFGHVRMLEQVLDHASSLRIIATWTETEALSLSGQSGTAISDLPANAVPGP